MRPRRVEVMTGGNAPYLGHRREGHRFREREEVQPERSPRRRDHQVDENSPAAKAGIKEGDVVLEYNGQPVEGGEQLSRLVRETPIGRQVKVGVWRNGSMQTLTAGVEAHKST